MPSSLDDNNFLIPKLDWEEWQSIMAPTLSPEPAAVSADYTSITASQITSMKSDELDKYLAHLSLLTDVQGKLFMRQCLRA